MPDSLIKHGARRVDTVAGVQQALDALIVFRPQFDFAEVPLKRCLVPRRARAAGSGAALLRAAFDVLQYQREA
jgi:hypothetical protein